LISKLSALLRRLLRSQEQFVTLRDELASIDEYLDIESIRFGPTLVIEKDICSDSLGLIIPNMVLQPLVENSIKHGIEKKIGGGQILIRSRRQNNCTVIEVIDNGTGMNDVDVRRNNSNGIGLRNVDERLRVIYGENCRLQLESTPGKGTLARIEIPELADSHRASA
jgi:two-component system LytT family sensor kinase